MCKLFFFVRTMLCAFGHVVCVNGALEITFMNYELSANITIIKDTDSFPTIDNSQISLYHRNSQFFRFSHFSATTCINQVSIDYRQILDFKSLLTYSIATNSLLPLIIDVAPAYSILIMS